MSCCEGKSGALGVGGFQELGCTLGQHSLVGCMNLARFVIHQMNLIAQVPEGLWSCLWGNIPREGFEGQCVLAEWYPEGGEYAIIKLREEMKAAARR